jgi:IclR family transcriptional regulator, KDG regulon repressor
MDLCNVAKEHLVELSKETNKTVHLVILDGKEGIYIDKVESSNATVLYSKIGRRVPIHSSGVGKALVAFKTSDELEKILDGYDYIQQTKKTLTDKASFLTELETIRERGYATDNEENEPGVYCVAMPVRDYTGQVIAAISSSTAVSQVTNHVVEKSVENLKRTAAQISTKMGYGFQSK